MPFAPESGSLIETDRSHADRTLNGQFDRRSLNGRFRRISPVARVGANGSPFRSHSGHWAAAAGIGLHAPFPPLLRPTRTGLRGWEADSTSPKSFLAFIASDGARA